jgi:hypothetical protein
MIIIILIDVVGVVAEYSCCRANPSCALSHVQVAFPAAVAILVRRSGGMRRLLFGRTSRPTASEKNGCKLRDDEEMNWNASKRLSGAMNGKA